MNFRKFKQGYNEVNKEYIKKFVENGMQVDFFPYPMHKHNVTGKDRVHLIQKVLTYILENNI